MKIYVAAPWDDRYAAADAAKKLERAGHTITHKWWDHESKLGDKGYDFPREKLAKFALTDYFGVINADLVFLVNSAKSEGKAVEQGVALAEEKPIIAIGKLGEFKNIFHYLPNYFWFSTVDEGINAIEGVVAAWDN